jgi:HEAT repeats
MTTNDLHMLFAEWKQWSVTADRSEDGWESDFPQWQALIEAAIGMMTQDELAPQASAILAECWAASQEDEELLTFASEHLDDCWPTLQALAQSSLPGCRWQVYEAVAGAGRPAEDILRQGLSDQDPYARRRALLSLARLQPSDAHIIAERFTKDPDPYMRQAAIEMALASTKQASERNTLNILKAGTSDPGTRSGNFVPDHQPPSALAEPGAPQRLYPNRVGCSRRQGGQINAERVRRARGE